MVIIKNKKAKYEYELIDKFICGIKLLGGEIKPIRNSKVSISESYCYVSNGEVFIKGMYIGENEYSGKYDSHDTKRLRKLLLNKKEIGKLSDGCKKGGLTIVPLSVIQTDTGLIKIEIALARGKKIHDKRNSEKAKELNKEIKKYIN
jgi:SsrA-binding protein